MAERVVPRERRVAVAGLGSVGWRVARALDAGIPGLRLEAVAARDIERARERVSGFAQPPQALDLPALSGEGDIVVECLPPEHFRAVAEPVLARGAVLVAASAGALLANADLPSLAERSGGRIIVPSGALAGLDALSAAKEAGLQEVRLITRKPPAAFGPQVETEDGVLPTSGLTEAVRLFAGSAREAVKRFPKNVNVAATVSLAGLGPDRTAVEVWADPGVTPNRHELTVRSAAGEVSVSALNLPDPDNPKSSAITGHSIVAALRRLTAPLAIGG